MSSSRRVCVAIWLVITSAIVALVGIFVGTLGALMNLSHKNDTSAHNYDSSVISSSSRLYGLYGKELYAALSPIDQNLNNRTDQIDFTLVFGQWHLDIVFMALGWLLTGCSIATILLPILRRQPDRLLIKVGKGASSCWCFCLGFCLTIFAFYDIALVVCVVLYYIFRDSANLATINFINNYAFGEKYAGDNASEFRTHPEVFSFTLLINYIQRTYNCCGFSSYRDYSGGAARLWTMQNMKFTSPPTLPLVCCADRSENATINGVTLAACRADMASNSYRAVNWNTIGCYQTIMNDIGQQVAVGLTAAVSIFIIVISKCGT